MAEHGPSEKAVEAAANAVQEEFDERGLGPANLLASVMLDEAHDRTLGLDRSVCLRDVAEWVESNMPVPARPVWRQAFLGTFTDERVTTGSEPRTYDLRLCSKCDEAVERNFRERWECPVHGDGITIRFMKAQVVESGHDEQTEDLKARLREVEAELAELRAIGDLMQSSLSRLVEAELPRPLSQPEHGYEVHMAALEGRTAIEDWTRARGVLEKGPVA